MKICLLVVGRTVEKYFIAAIEEYVERTRHYIPFEMEVIPELKNTKSLSESQQKEREADLLLRAFQPGDFIVLLDEHGKEFRSTEFAMWIDKKMQQVPRRLVFVIGGSYGLGDDVLRRSNFALSFSKLTFPHQLMRVLFCEQLYRCARINSGQKYHK